MAEVTPSAVFVRAHQCGFGDTLLISFEYPKALDDGRRERHILCDFGSTRRPKGAPDYGAIARSVAERTDGQLDVVVVTHRHKDHIDGFGDEEAGEIIAGLKPRLVVRSWTEQPDLPKDAKGPGKVGAKSLGFAANMKAAEDFVREVHSSLDGARGMRRSLAMLAAHQIPNEKAIDRLDQLAADAALGARYLYAGQDSGIEEAVPGVAVSVLGPPTPDMWPQVAKERADDPEYWISQGRRLRCMLANAGEPLDDEPEVPSVLEEVPPGPARWLVEKMRGEQTSSLLRIVETLDDAMNNTSLILHFTVAKRHLLFPGDAQIENWSYCLQPGKAAELGVEDLGEVDLYKVGHHGSRNATPRSLVETWRKKRHKVTSVMSTLPGVHGRSEATAVPRATLIAALEELGPLARTDQLPPGSLYLDFRGSTSRRTAYVLSEDKGP
ncbi:MAG TPA: hypothetical protein VLC07_07040 [Solirubrobacterales bacterium]|nr:hypothetical protein [Solirubrobacterales bacterium]